MGKKVHPVQELLSTSVLELEWNPRSARSGNSSTARESRGTKSKLSKFLHALCTLAAALYFEQSSCDELMEFKQIQTRAQPEESLKHNHSCTNLSIL